MHLATVIVLLCFSAVLNECRTIYAYVEGDNVPSQRVKRWYYPGGGFYPLGGGGGFPGAGGWGGTSYGTDISFSESMNIGGFSTGALFGK